MKIREYKLGDEEGILDLKRCVFGSKDPFKLKKEAWEWEFMANPEGESLIIVAEEGDQIIGHYGLLPLKFSYYGRIITLGLAVDLMVHPSFRRRGLFLKIFERVVEGAKRRNMSAILGFPNRITLPTYVKKLGWHHIKSLKVHIKLFARNVLKKRNRTDSNGTLSSFCWENRFRLEFLRIENFLHSEKFDRSCESGLIFKDRSLSYLNWRYIEPHWYGYKAFSVLINGKANGFFVLRFMGYKGFNTAVLIDLFPYSLACLPIFKDLIQAISSMCFNLGAQTFVFLDPMRVLSPFTCFSVELAEYLSPRPWYVGWKGISSVGVPLGKDFYLTFGDADVI